MFHKFCAIKLKYLALIACLSNNFCYAYIPPNIYIYLDKGFVYVSLSESSDMKKKSESE